jgi:hypothetical protein
MNNNETPAQRSGYRRLMSSRRGRWAAAGVAAALAATGVSVGLATSSGTTAPASTVSAGGVPAGPAGGAGNARSAPASGGAVGTVSALSSSSFTLTTSGGQKVTVNEVPTTTFQKDASRSSASDLASGDQALVLGTTSGNTISADQVIVQPATSGGSTTSAASVVPFQRGAPATAKQVGQIPANYTEGSGTIVSGTDAANATEAALAAYPGGVVDRVVQLSNGEYEVHNIGVNWPHHIFVSENFKVLGAD